MDNSLSDTVRKSADKYLSRFGGQLVNGTRIVAARSRAKSEKSWQCLQDLYQAWEDRRWESGKNA